MADPFYACEVVEQALYKLGDHYDPASAEQNVADAQDVVDALHAAGFRIMRDPSDAPACGRPWSEHPSVDGGFYCEKSSCPATCPHDALSGDEGPVALLGRMPTRWRCDDWEPFTDSVSADHKPTDSGDAPKPAVVGTCACGHPLVEHFANGCGWCLCKVSGPATGLVATPPHDHGEQGSRS